MNRQGWIGVILAGLLGIGDAAAQPGGVRLGAPSEAESAPERLPFKAPPPPPPALVIVNSRAVHIPTTIPPREIVFQRPASENAVVPAGGFQPVETDPPGVLTQDAGFVPTQSQFWFGAEYLFWQARGMYVPALVTQAPAGASGTDVGGLSNPATSILFGDDRILTDFRSGLSLRTGCWFDVCQNVGIDASAFWLGRQSENFTASSDGNPGLFRPFYTDAGTSQSELVAFLDPNVIGGGVLFPVVAGAVTVNATTDLAGWDVNLRSNFRRDDVCRVDFLFGYRYLRLRDTLGIREDLVTTSVLPEDPPLGTTFTINDHFETTNEFHGAQIGLTGEVRGERWFLNWVTKIAFGNTHRETLINGQTIVAVPGIGSATYDGGLLAQQTNIGRYLNDDFAVTPEVGLSVGCFVTSNLRIFGGYNFLYWSRVGRAGDQIDLTLSQIPPTPPQGLGRPSYPNAMTDFWAHGVKAGVELKY